MAQQDEDDLKIQLRKAESARARAAEEWERLDAVFYSEMPLIEKAAIMSHLRTANSRTGEQWGGAARHARAMSVSPDRAERVMRKLRKDGVFDLVEAKKGYPNKVILVQSWVAEVELHYLEWKKKRPPVRTPGLPPTPGTDTGTTPGAETGRPPVPAPAYPLTNPPTPCEGSNPAGAPSDTSGDAASSQVATATNDPTPLPPPLPGLQEQQIDAELVLQQDIPWVDPGKVSPKHAFGVWFDAPVGKLYLINDERGKSVYRSLRDDAITPRQIAAGIGLACGPAGSRSARNGGHVGLVRQWCLIVKEREEQRAGRQGASNGYAKGDAAPRSFGGWK